MADRGTLLLALAYLGALGWLAFEWQRPLPQPTASAPTAAVESGPVRLPRNRMPARTRFDEIVQRPLFSADRRPIEEAVEAPAAPVAGPSQRAGDRLTSMRLSAILVDNKRLIALVEQGDGKATTLRKGAELVGWQVEDIQDDHIVLALRGQRRALFVHEFDPPAPPRRNPPARAGKGNNGPTRAPSTAAKRPPTRPTPAHRR